MNSLFFLVWKVFGIILRRKWGMLKDFLRKIKIVMVEEFIKRGR